MTEVQPGRATRDDQRRWQRLPSTQKVLDQIDGYQCTARPSSCGRHTGGRDSPDELQRAVTERHANLSSAFLSGLEREKRPDDVVRLHFDLALVGPHCYSRSKPCDWNFSVRQFSVTARTTWSEAPSGRFAA